MSGIDPDELTVEECEDIAYLEGYETGHDVGYTKGYNQALIDNNIPVVY